ncbi:MAG: hypothetical protein QOE40_1707 [Actinomycetota bacterium]|nr:hypothetical protein [Actinomycetota bacterium]
MTLPSGPDQPSGTPVPDSAHRMNKGFSLRSAFSLAFADISPIVALYAIFALGLFAAGPAFFWAFPVVLAGQLLVAGVFGELSSRWPFAGSVYQWARHVHGTSLGWFAAWAYMWGLTIALSALAYGAAGFLLAVFDFEDPSRFTTTAVALAIVLAGTLCNIVGRSVLKTMVTISIICEVVGSVGLGTVLLLFHRENSLSVLFDGFGTASAGAWLTGPFLVAIAYVGWSFLGFEAAGSIAEEVEDPERNVPKAIILSLLFVALTVMYAGIAVILAIPNLEQVIADASSDPVTDTLVAAFGDGIGRPLLILFVIGFLSSFLAVQAAVSRCVWGSARDNSLPGSRFLGKLAGRERLPVNAIALTGAVAALLILLAGSKLYGVLINFTTIGFYIAFGCPVIGAALSRLRGTWTPGPFNLGRWGAPVTYAASVWIIAETINIAWPRNVEGQVWYLDWSMLLTTVALGAVGIVVYLRMKPHILDPYGQRIAAEQHGASSTPLDATP